MLSSASNNHCTISPRIGNKMLPNINKCTYECNHKWNRRIDSAMTVSLTPSCSWALSISFKLGCKHFHIDSLASTWFHKYISIYPSITTFICTYEPNIRSQSLLLKIMLSIKSHVLLCNCIANIYNKIRALTSYIWHILATLYRRLSWHLLKLSAFRAHTDQYIMNDNNTNVNISG